METDNTLFKALKNDKISLQNKVVMAPMTRSRATTNHIPTEIMATFYAQRADAGLLITEGTAPSPNGAGYPRIPGIYNNEQVAAWQKVTDAVHKKGAKIFVQLMHSGRVSHPDNMPETAQVLAPSAIAPENTKMYVDGKGEQDIPLPKEMTKKDIEITIEEHVQSAKNAIAAGFDGVELHGANGYLLEQFINTNTNKRTDNYGGSVENRSRFTLEIAQQVVEAIGAHKVGIRLSPNGALNDVGPFDGQEETFAHLVKELEKLNLLYIHLINHESMGAPALPDAILKNIRDTFSGLLILSGGYDPESANEALEKNDADLVAFGRPFIANPDLLHRWQNGRIALNEPNPDLFYTPGPEGYTDYPIAK